MLFQTAALLFTLALGCAVVRDNTINIDADADIDVLMEVLFDLDLCDAEDTAEETPWWCEEDPEDLRKWVEELVG